MLLEPPSTFPRAWKTRRPFMRLRLGLVAPVVERVPDRVRQGRGHLDERVELEVVATRLEHKDCAGAVRAEPVGQDRAGRTAANYDEVGRLSIICPLLLVMPTSASPRQGAVIASGSGREFCRCQSDGARGSDAPVSFGFGPAGDVAQEGLTPLIRPTSVRRRRMPARCVCFAFSLCAVITWRTAGRSARSTPRSG